MMEAKILFLHFTKRPIRYSVVCLTCLMSTHGMAEIETNNPITFNAAAGWTHDDNLFRVASNPQSDTIRRLTLGTVIDVPVSLQRLSVEATVSDNHYQHFSHLDYVGGRAKGAWNWRIGDRLFGDAGYEYNRIIADFGDLQSQSRDLITQETPFFSINYALTPEWQLIGQLARSDTEHDNTARNSLDSHVNTESAGVQYTTGANNTVGFRVRQSDANYPNRESIALIDAQGNSIGNVQQVNNGYREQEASIFTTWNLSGVSLITARLGHTQRKHDELSSRNFSGATGDLTYHWVPSEKTSIDVNAYRQIRSSDDLSASYVLFRGIAIAPVWKVSPLIALKLRSMREFRSYDGAPSLALDNGAPRKDSFQSTQISMTYTPPIRNTEIVIAIETGKRDSNMNTFDYSYKLASGQIKLSF